MPKENEFTCDVKQASGYDILGQQERDHEGKKYRQEHDGKFIPALEKHSQPETFDLLDQEIVATGKWKGEVFTKENLQNIVDAYNELSKNDKVNIPIKLGHDDKQKLLQKDGYPSAGWVKNLRVIADKIVGDFKSIPAKIYKIIKNKGYKSISPEIYRNYTDADTGKKYKDMLWAIALLGVDHKAMTTLDDLVKVYSNEEEAEPILKIIEPIFLEFQEEFNCECIKCGHKMTSEKHCNELKCSECGGQMRRVERPGPGQPTEEEKAKLKHEEEELMDEKAKKEFEDRIKHLEEEVKTGEEEKGKLQSGLDEATEKLGNVELENRITEFKAVIEAAKKEGKILPAQEEMYLSFFSAMPKGTVIKFSIDGKEKEGNALDSLKAIIDSMPNLVEFAELTEQESEDGKDKTSEKYKSDGIPVEGAKEEAKIRAYAEEHKISYSDALREMEE